MQKNCEINKYPELLKPYKLIAFDWDGTAVKDRSSNTEELAEVLEKLLERNVIICIITGTNVNNIHRQLVVNIKSTVRQKICIFANRGSEVYGYNQLGAIILLDRKIATKPEEMKLTNVAEDTIKEVLKHSKFKINLISNRLNRRKLDLFPEWEDPKKDEVEILRRETFRRFKHYKFQGGIKGVYDIIFQFANIYNLDARVTSDVKHLEIGITDKQDSILWLLENVAKINNINDSQILIGGDEFSPIDGIDGSDYKMVVADHPQITYFSVGIEPEGVPDGIIDLRGGPGCFMNVLKKQVDINNIL